jgi:hypothetical protein
MKVNNRRQSCRWLVQRLDRGPQQEPGYAEAMARAQATLYAELGTAGSNWSSPPVLWPAAAGTSSGTRRQKSLGQLGSNRGP